MNCYEVSVHYRWKTEALSASDQITVEATTAASAIVQALDKMQLYSPNCTIRSVHVSYK